jgi:hypothetical protein
MKCLLDNKKEEEEACNPSAASAVDVIWRDLLQTYSSSCHIL